MKKLLFICILLLASSCQRNGSETWEDVKTAGRYIKKSFNAVLGKDEESRQFTSQEDFSGPKKEEFIALEDSDLNAQKFTADAPIAQPAAPPSEILSKTSGSDQFDIPPSYLNTTFKLLHFDTDDHVIKEKEDLIVIARIANYMKQHPNAYVLIEGHCDQRASADYNLPLGMRRAQHIRVLLVKQGVNPDHLYTVSYGKEKPVSLGNSSKDFFQNRRAQFKLFVKE